METIKWKNRWGEKMKTVKSYGKLIHEDGTIVSKTTYYFDNLKELLDFRDTLHALHMVDLENAKIEIREYVQFEKYKVEWAIEEAEKEGEEE